ncbi:hypothetical protein A3C86_00525 [Candidatus Kaiserbacteria bacterium RIFCSPHIGHO2_02_FULL_49_16]|uniref:Uncharacterized protein n=1 Tax=Candidatus Kaiserbacteria bacterium RIFCSPHIGHO2_02_FULL_49_16 TaxID=1798490 RepID=A0A1F6DCR5_9BACT|nr:MAG: hypothetical protein A3C86_00525 [Candidatus Kaiserbacteria bacterium RIFCSPHIGHO2_02_FULL_49_16]
MTDPKVVEYIAKLFMESLAPEQLAQLNARAKAAPEEMATIIQETLVVDSGRASLVFGRAVFIDVNRALAESLVQYYQRMEVG